MTLSLVPVDDLELVELAAIANARHGEIDVALGRLTELFHRTALQAMDVGDALLQAKELVPHGQWQDWMLANLEFSATNASMYMRFARGRPVLEAAAAKAGGRLSLVAGQNVLRRLNTLDREELESEARQLYADGSTVNAIACALGKHFTTVQCWVDPKFAREHRTAAKRREQERRDGVRALERERVQKEIKRRGGLVADAYALLRRSLAALDAAARDSEDADVRSGLNAALAHGHQAEDEIVRALKLSRRER